MTGPYEWNPMPHRVDVACPACRKCAAFEFAEVVRIGLKSDVGFFVDSPVFEYQPFRDGCGHVWHGAVCFEGLHGDPRRAIGGLPPGYSAEDWAHSRYLRGDSGWRAGAVRCPHCGLRGKHELSWPEDAYYAVAHRGHVLWAFHRESAVDLLDYLSSTARDVSKYRWSLFLMRVPTVFQERKAREAVTRQVGKLLAG